MFSTLWQRFVTYWKAVTEPRLPKVGEYWRYIRLSDGSPWEQQQGELVVIIAVQDGWIRFASGAWDDRRRRLSDFFAWYSWHESADDLSMRLVERLNGTYQETGVPLLPTTPATSDVSQMVVRYFNPSTDTMNVIVIPGDVLQVRITASKENKLPNLTVEINTDSISVSRRSDNKIISALNFTDSYNEFLRELHEEENKDNGNPS